jgi:hypothetical protein
VAERTRARRGTAGSSRRTAREEPTGGRLNRDYSEEEYREPSEGYQGPEPTRGLYTCKLIDLKDHTTQDGNESTKWLFQLVEGSETKEGDDVSGWYDSQYTTENTAWREQQMLVALGVIKPNGKVNLSYEAILKKAKPCTVRVGTERYIDDDGNATNRGRMQAFLPLRDTAPKRRNAKDEDATDVFDDEEDGDDEEEEPEPPRRTTSRSRRRAAEPEPEPDDEPGEDEEEDYDPDELAAELEDLTLVQLKKRARDEFGIKIKRGDDQESIINAILDEIDPPDPTDQDEEDEEPEDEPEEEPEPPKRRARGASAKAGAGGTTTRRRASKSQEPPF